MNETNPPDESIADPEIWDCLNNPVVVPSPIKTADERRVNPSALTVSFREFQERLKQAGLVSDTPDAKT